MRAYFTVEAALVMPVVFYVYVFIIYMTFYQYNRCVWEQDIYIQALRGSSRWNWSNESVYEKITEGIYALDTEKFMLLGKPVYEVKVGKGRVRIEADSSMQFPFSGLLQMRKINKWSIHVEEESGRLSPVQFIRGCRRLERIISE